MRVKSRRGSLGAHGVRGESGGRGGNGGKGGSGGGLRLGGGGRGGGSGGLGIGCGNAAEAGSRVSQLVIDHRETTEEREWKSRVASIIVVWRKEE